MPDIAEISVHRTLPYTFVAKNQLRQKPEPEAIGVINIEISGRPDRLMLAPLMYLGGNHHNDMS